MFQLMHYYIKARIKLRFLLVGTRCPDNYPYAFMWGAYCCKTRVEDDAKANLKECNGSPISLHSVCCENSEYQRCSNVEGCINNRGIVI